MDHLLSPALRRRAPAPRSATTARGPRCRRPGACRLRGGSGRARLGVAEAAIAAASPALPGDTSYVCVVDRHGNVFSGTPSDVSWESPVIPGLGFCPSSRGSQSWAVPGHPSCVAPGKRPRLTPNPALARRGRQWTMAFGAPGGDLQPQGMLQVFLNHTVFGMSLQEAVEAPRFVTHSFPGSFEPHPYYPGAPRLEHGIAAAVGEALAARGHASVAARSVDGHGRRLRGGRRSRRGCALRRRRPPARRPRDGLVSALPGHVQTVLGPIAPEAIGITLPHEHLLIDFKVMFVEPSRRPTRDAPGSR